MIRSIHQDPQALKDLRSSLHLIKNHQAAQRREHHHWLVQGRRIIGVLQIEKSRPSVTGYLPGQRGLAALARSEQNHSGVARKTALHGGCELLSLNHSSILDFTYLFCND
jgi:hypothetical protein